jgi:hypothetical protein
MEMSLETLLLLKQCLEERELAIGHPKFRETALQVIAAQAELEAAIEQARPMTEAAA